MCEFKGEKGCKKTSLKLNAGYFFGSSLALGNITDISKSCMCINTRYCMPLSSMIKLFLTFKRNVLDISVKVNKFAHLNRLHDIMSVEVLNPSKEYIDFVDSFGSMSEAQKMS